MIDMNTQKFHKQVLQAEFQKQGNLTARDNLMRGYTQRVWKQVER